VQWITKAVPEFHIEGPAWVWRSAPGAAERLGHKRHNHTIKQPASLLDRIGNPPGQHNVLPNAVSKQTAPKGSDGASQISMALHWSPSNNKWSVCELAFY